MTFTRIAMIARWKPVHVGQAAVLRALCNAAGQVSIGVGSSNRYNARNPFTYEETEAMLRLVLGEIPIAGDGNGSKENKVTDGDGSRVKMLRLALGGLDTSRKGHRTTRPAENYEILPVPDLDDGPRWRVMVKEMLGELDVFVTDNPYVADLMKDEYRLMRPVEFLSPSEHIYIDGSTVRAMMARGERWQDWVPGRVAQYIEENRLDERFRREFGLETLAMQSIIE